MLEENLRSHIEKCLSSKQGQAIKVTGTQALSGGCINESVELKTNIGSFFLKWNNAGKYPNMFETEALGL